MLNKKVIIFGNGSMAKSLYSYMRDEYAVVGFCVDRALIKEKTFCNLPIVAFEEVEKYFSPNEHVMINSVGFIQMNELRETRCNQSEEKGYQLISYIHKNVKIHDDVKIGKNCIILDFVSIHAGTTIEDGTFISSNTNIGHDCHIGKYNWINSGVSISGYVTIGSKCFWGVNSCAVNNISIGCKNYIGANTLISKNTNNDEVYISPSGEIFRLNSEKFLKFIG